MPLTPISHWIGFHLALLLLLAAELIYARRQTRAGRPPYRTAVVATALWITAALAFAVYITCTLGPGSSLQYLAGYALEESLSIDNLFVFLLLFRVFQITPAHQPKVLFWGVAGAILMRGLFIAAGLNLLDRFQWIAYLFALILLIAAVRLLFPTGKKESDAPPRWIAWLSHIHPVSQRQDGFFVVEDGRRMATILLLALIAIELADIVFALDSIPAVLSITRQPFLAYTSNIMAVMGLRSLYFLLIGMLVRLRFLHYGVAAILGFAAFKMLAARFYDVPPLTSLAVIVGILAVTIASSLLIPKPTESQL
jgi:tellurite resistance protein TerC